MERKEITSPVKAIRAKCLECVCYQREEVKLCPSTDCALHPFRFGKNPYRAPASEERKEASRQRMLALQARKKVSENND